MENIPLAIWLWFVALVIQTIAFTAVGTWWVSRLLAAIRADIVAHRRELDRMIADAENDWRDRSERGERMVGETVGALRQHFHTFELFVRDTYVRRESFFGVVDGMKGSLKEFGDRIEKHMDVMDKKIDRLQARSLSEE